jgi:hypothetical protein
VQVCLIESGKERLIKINLNGCVIGRGGRGGGRGAGTLLLLLLFACRLL